MEIKGKFNTAVIYADIIGENTISQVFELINQEFTVDSKIRIMPDCHAGVGCVIGTTMTIKDKVVPNLVGVDIGCGMKVVKLGKVKIDFEKLDNFIKDHIPSGMKVNEHIVDHSIKIESLKCYEFLKNKTYLKKSIGTLGGGNHFIEIDKDDEDNYYLIIHSGSRNLGAQVAKIYQLKAKFYHQNRIYNKFEEKQKVIKEFKAQGKSKYIEQKLKEIDAKTIHLPIPESLCYLEGKEFDEYIFDMDICQKFAEKNREIIARKIVEFLGLNYTSLDGFETIHNYINMNDMILRKGAIAAYKDQVVLIPINMRDGCIIAKGKGNPEYNYSAPHGAGRLLSRGDAKMKIGLQEFEESMKRIYTTSVNYSTIDESPFAYKPIESILENIQDTVDIIQIIKPVYNYKCCD
jgi:RNA-splicing ligase RtcB